MTKSSIDIVHTGLKDLKIFFKAAGVLTAPIERAIDSIKVAATEGQKNKVLLLPYHKQSLSLQEQTLYTSAEQLYKMAILNREVNKDTDKESWIKNKINEWYTEG